MLADALDLSYEDIPKMEHPIHTQTISTQTKTAPQESLKRLSSVTFRSNGSDHHSGSRTEQLQSLLVAILQVSF